MGCVLSGSSHAFQLSVTYQHNDRQGPDCSISRERRDRLQFGCLSFLGDVRKLRFELRHHDDGIHPAPAAERSRPRSCPARKRGFRSIGLRQWQCCHEPALSVAAADLQAGLFQRPERGRSFCPAFAAGRTCRDRDIRPPVDPAAARRAAGSCAALSRCRAKPRVCSAFAGPTTRGSRSHGDRQHARQAVCLDRR